MPAKRTPADKRKLDELLSRDHKPGEAILSASMDRIDAIKGSEGVECRECGKCRGLYLVLIANGAARALGRGLPG